MNSPTSSLHIVRQFGPVGGMERYVWELTHALRSLGQEVSVLCEASLETPDPKIHVTQLGAIKAKPRWLSMMRFSGSVTAAIRQMNLEKDCIIHSHERTDVHRVTSFHGPSILSRKKGVLDKLSPRLLAWEFLEKRELASSRVKAVLPNSLIVSNQLKALYPGITSRIEEPMYPGVATSFFPAPKRPGTKTIGFIGREWRRKGLEFAADVVNEMRMQDSEVNFLVAGCPKEEVKHLFKDWQGGHHLVGWCEPEVFYRQIDLLILPSRNEPFGMVVAEANASNVPVVISKQCGIAPLIHSDQGIALPLNETAPSQWIKECQRLMISRAKIPSLNLTWTNLAKQHMSLYHQLSGV